ncbi:MAG: glutamine synthetase family protein [Eubacteriales bacterium]|nr:glutamine synthetase family protein [Eubacteriales bacterium]
MRTKEEIAKMIEAEDVEFLRLQFADAFGNLKNIAVTTGQLERVMNNQFSFEGSAVFDNQYQIDEELYLYPDLDSFVILPWRPQQRKVAKVICDVCHEDGTLYEMSPRTILKRAIAIAESKGYRFMINPECEFYLFHTDEDGMPTTVTHESAGYLDVGPFDYGENARRDIVLTLEEMGFEIESSHHELSPAQHEIDFAQSESLEIADAVMTFKLAVRSIARRFGLYATFMPKPKTELAGSGMHLNISMYQGEKNLFDPDENGELSQEARYFTGGIMRHISAVCALTNPIVNSYKRLRCGAQAPHQVDFAMEGESALIKYRKRHGESKVELRFPDTSANPYLAIAVCILAGIEGIEQKINPEDIQNEVKYMLPGSLDLAVHALEKDELIRKCLGRRFTQIYAEIKNREWQEYMSEVTDWERQRYLNRL